MYLQLLKLQHWLNTFAHCISSAYHQANSDHILQHSSGSAASLLLQHPASAVLVVITTQSLESTSVLLPEVLCLALVIATAICADAEPVLFLRRHHAIRIPAPRRFELHGAKEAAGPSR